MKDCAYIAGIDGRLLEKQIEALLASSFRDDCPEECDGIANLLGSVLDGLRGETEIPIETYRDGTTLVRAIDGEGRTTYRAVRGFHDRCGSGKQVGYDTTSLFDAWERANPNIVEGASIVWERSDFEDAMSGFFDEFDETDVDEVVLEASLENWWKDEAFAKGIDLIEEAANRVDLRKEEVD